MDGESMMDLNTGALAPVADEVDVFEFQVRGTIPQELNGTLIRNGPNPYSGRFGGRDMLGWWPEAAMLHAITLQDGEVLGYRNRWARSRQWAAFQGREDAAQFLETNPNVNVIQHAGTTLALAEGGLPLAIRADGSTLESLGLSERHAALNGGVTAHPKLDPETGELIWFKSDWAEPWLSYGVLDAQGNSIVAQNVEVPGPAMTHDCAITQRYSLLLDLSVGYDFSLLEQGVRIPICWSNERASRLGIVPRHGGAPRWFEIEPCFIQHVVNAFDYSEDDGPERIVLDAVRYPWFLKRGKDDFLPNPLGTLWRYEIALDTGRVVERQLDDTAIELPRINEALNGRTHRYLYAVEQPTDREMRGVIRFDTATGSLVRHSVAAGDQNSEPVFVARPGSHSEDDGWVLVCVYRGATDTSDLLILDAADLRAEPLALISLGRRIPAGFHGAWLPAIVE